MALALWVAALPDLRWRVGVALLWLLPAAVPFKLSMSWWGTHDFTVLLQALFLVPLVRWLDAPTATPLRRVMIVGAAGAVATVLNTSLLLPAGLCLGWIAAGPFLLARRLPDSAGALAVGAATLLGAWALIAASPVGRGLDLPLWLFASDKLDQLGGLDPRAVLTGWRMALPSSWPLLPAGLAAVWLLTARRPTWTREALLPAFAALLVLGWLVMAGAPFAQGGSADQPGAGFRPRYTAQLYPVAAVVLAGWAVAGRRWRLAVFGALLLVQAPIALRMLDPDNLGAGGRFDGLRAFAATYSLDEAPEVRERSRFAQASPAFLDGYLLLRRYQDDDYWTWLSPRAAAARPHARLLAEHVRRRCEDAGPARAECLNGAGYALCVVLPTSRRSRFHASMEPFSESDQQALLAGCGLAPWAALRAAPRAAP